ncbi:MAG TPA: fibronectin type III domain-containing protein [Pyrinomonadaceae bacterium]|jgi:beta-lactamase superfamily II metal-dependent hydrolase|nr:fibronectin type III domain-containing protein [Pyrinomonadaceae bacterium]
MHIGLTVRRLFVLCAFLVFPLVISAQQLEIHYINVSWGGAVLVKGPNGTTVLMEAGNTGKGTAYVVPYLQSIGIMPANGLDYTIAGHQHCDHIGGLDEVVQAGYNVHLKNYYNGSSYASSCVDQWNSAAATTTAGAPVVAPVGTQILLGNGAKLTIVARNGSIIGGGTVSVSDENDRSIAVLIQYGGFDYIWASDMGGGNIDEACTGRFTSSQTDVESSVIQAISPGGAFPLISAGGIDVLHVNHHGSESSTNINWMNLSKPAVALISTGSGQSSGWDLPRIDVVEHVLLAQATACITVPPALVLQTEEGAPVGSLTSFAGYCVGDIKVTTDGVSTFTVSADGAVTQGANELAASALPRTFNLDDVSGPPDTTPPVISGEQASNITAGSATVTWTTDEASNSVVEYGLTTGYGSTASDATNVTSHSVPLNNLATNTLYHYRAKSTDAAGNTATSADHSFQTGGSTSYAPSGTTILQGTLSSGSFSNLATNNASYYVVNSTTSGQTRFADWYASVSVSELPSSVSKLTITYDGQYSRNGRTQTLYLYNWTTSSWTQIDSRTVGTSDVTITSTQTSPANFVSGTGQIRLRVLGSGGANKSFTCSGDYVQFTVETAGTNISRSSFGNRFVVASLFGSTLPASRDPALQWW